MDNIDVRMLTKKICDEYSMDNGNAHREAILF